MKPSFVLLTYLQTLKKYLVGPVFTRIFISIHKLYIIFMAFAMMLSGIFLVLAFMPFYDRLLASATPSMIWMNETSSTATAYDLPLLKLPYGTWKPANYDPLADASPRFPLSNSFPFSNMFKPATHNTYNQVTIVFNHSIHPPVNLLTVKE
jgi:hypothetical protein